MLNLGDAKYYVAWYLGDADRRNPYASPVFGDAAGLPPSLIQVGDDEMLRDDAMTMAERLRAAGVPTELELWPRMPHVWHMLARVMPEGSAGDSSGSARYPRARPVPNGRTRD